MAPAPTTKLERLIIEEVSVVDDPANDADGWMVLKSTDRDKLLDEVERIEKDVENAVAAVELMMSDYLADAPDDVKAAAVTVHEYLSGLYGESDPGSDASANTKERTPLRERIANFLKRRDDLDVEFTLDDVKEVAKAVLWTGEQATFEKTRNALNAALVDLMPGGDGEAKDVAQSAWVRDFTADEVLITSYEAGEEKSWIAKYTLDGDEVTIAPKTEWTEATQSWVTAD